MEALARFGVTVTQDGNVFTVSGHYASPGTLSAEGDWSNAAFWLVGTAISNSRDFALHGLSSDSVQGDRAIVALLEKAGFSIVNENGALRVTGGENRRSLCVDAEAIPDLVPILAVLASALPGESVIYNAERLIHKESDRLQSVHDMLTALGGNVTITADGLRIAGGTVQGFNDHRIVMSAAIAALICKESVTIVGAEAVNKSYPTFFDEIEKRGMSVWHLSGDET